MFEIHYDLKFWRLLCYSIKMVDFLGCFHSGQVGREIYLPKMEIYSSKTTGCWHFLSTCSDYWWRSKATQEQEIEANGYEQNQLF